MLSRKSQRSSPGSQADSNVVSEPEVPPILCEATTGLNRQRLASFYSQSQSAKSTTVTARTQKRTNLNLAKVIETRQRADSPHSAVVSSEMCRGLGAKQRAERIGPELNLVASFLNNRLFAAPARCEMAIFQEPRIPSGFPDLVLVIWRPDVVREWCVRRQELKSEDIRLAHYLFQVGPTPLQVLNDGLERNNLTSLERLYEAGVAKPYRDRWRLKPIREIFAVQQLIAVEAKVSEWKAGLDQAWLNTWFASDSYLLLPHIPRRSQVLERAKHIGVGVCTDKEQVMAPTCRPKLPASYASWLFNEWIGRIPMLAGTNGKRLQC